MSNLLFLFMLFTLQLSKLTQLGHLTSKGKKKVKPMRAIWTKESGISSELFIPNSEGKIKCLVCGFVSNTIRVVFSSIKYNKSNQFTMRPLQREECAIEPMGRKYIFLSGSGWLWSGWAFPPAAPAKCRVGAPMSFFLHNLYLLLCSLVNS